MNTRDLIRDRLAALGWSQRQLADQCGMNQPDLARYLAGRADMTGERLDRVMRAMGWNGAKWRKPKTVKA